MKLKILIASSLALAACVPTNVPPGKDTAADAGQDAGATASLACQTCACACATLSVLHCPEAAILPPGDCVSTCEHVQSMHAMDMKPGCIAASKTVEDVRQCGTVRCLESP